MIRPGPRLRGIRFFALAAAFAVAPHANADELRLGLAEVDITPPVGMRMADNFREHISTGIQDRLHAKAVVFTQGGERAALVICDLTAMSREVADRARALAGEKTGIPADHISVGATHTHGGVLYYDVRNRLWHEQAVKANGQDPHQPIDYPAFLAGKCAEAIERAHARAVPARLTGGVVPQPGLAFNRRYHMKDGSVVFNPGKRNPNIVRPAGPTDPDLHLVFAADAETKRPLGMLSVFAMHVATFGGDSYGADFPMHLQEKLRAAFGPEFISVFGEGCAGDVNHVDVSSGIPQTSDREPARIGAALAKTVIATQPGLPPLETPSLAVRSRVVRWPLQEITDEQVTRALELFSQTGPNAPAFLVAVEAHKILEVQGFRKLHGDSLPMEIRVIRLSADTAIVTLPHEIFVELGLAIKQASPFRNTLVLSLCNDVDFYVPTRKAFAEGSYEVVTARVKPGAGEALVAAAGEMLGELKPK
jgi:neutral ceramidase